MGMEYATFKIYNVFPPCTKTQLSLKNKKGIACCQLIFYIIFMSRHKSKVLMYRDLSDRFITKV